MSSAIAIPVVDQESRRLQLCAQTDNVPEPSLRSVLLVAVGSSILFVLTAASMTSFPALVDRFGDSQGYMNIAEAIRHWNFHHIVVKQFWGYSYAIALVSGLTGVSDRVALLGISYFSYLISVGLAHRLWGGWVAAFFAVLNFDWLQRAMLGGSEPLFMALLLGAFVMVRRECWGYAALLASLATVTRPLGIFALVGIGLVLLRRRQFKRLALVIGISGALGALYVWPMATHLGDPLATVHSYQSSVHDRWLFGIPFYAIVEGTLRYPAPWTNLALSFLWIAFISAGAAAMALDKAFREYAKRFPVEVLFAAPYFFTVFAYNYPTFARSNFARFAIPIIPFVLLALRKWVPRNRIALAAVALLCPVLAAISALGLQNLVHRVF